MSGMTQDPTLASISCRHRGRRLSVVSGLHQWSVTVVVSCEWSSSVVGRLPWWSVVFVGRWLLSVVSNLYWWSVVFVGGRWSSSVVGGLCWQSVTCICCVLFCCQSLSVVSHRQSSTSSVVVARQSSSVVSRCQSSSVISYHQSSVNIISQCRWSSFVVGLHCQLSVVVVDHLRSSVTVVGRRRLVSGLSSGRGWC